MKLRLLRYRNVFIFFAFSILVLVCEWNIAQMQKQSSALSLAQVLTALQSKSSGLKLPQKNKFIIQRVKERGVTFQLTSEIEKELRNTGATNELIEAIRQKSPPVSTPTPNVTPVFVPTPKPVYTAYLERGDEFFKRFDFDWAIEEYNKVLELAPQNTTAFIQRGYAYHYKGDDFRAVADYSSAIKINAGLTSEPSLSCLLFNENSNIEATIEKCNEAIFAKPNFSLLYYKRGDVYRQKALSSQQKEDFNNAINDYTKALDLYPNFLSVYIVRGVTFADSKDFAKALVDYNKAIVMDPNNLSVYFLRGQLYNEMKNYDLAILEFDRIIGLDGKSAPAFYERGVTLFNKKDYDKAILDLTRSTKLDPKYVEAHRFLGYVYFKREKYDLAVTFYTKALELNPRSHAVFNERGLAFLERKDYDKAISDFNKAIEIAPKYSEAYSNRGRAFFSKKNYLKALEDYTKAIEFDAKNANAYRNRANLYDKIGDKGLAKNDRDKAELVEKGNR